MSITRLFVSAQLWLQDRAEGAGHGEDGMSTAEYAIGTIAAAAFAATLIAVVKSGGIKNALSAIIEQALTL